MASFRRGSPSVNHPFRRIQLKRSDATKYERGYLGYLGLALKTAHNTQATWETMLERGDSPDIILGCASNGLAFNLRRIFPEALLVSYTDSKLENLLVRDRDLFAARRLIQEIQFAQSDLRFIRFLEEKSRLDQLGQKTFHHLPLFVDTEFYAPAAKKSDISKMIVLAGALSEQDMHELWISLVNCVCANPKIHIFIVAENSLRKFPWQQSFSSLQANLSQRIRVELNLVPIDWRFELHTSRLVFCPRPDLPARQRLLEAMACGLPLLTDRQFANFQAGQNMLELKENEHLPVRINKLLAMPDYLHKIGMAARNEVMAEYNMDAILPGHIESIIQARGMKNG